MKSDFIIISIILLFIANISVMYYRNCEGFLTKDERDERKQEREEQKAIKKLDKAIEMDEKKLDSLNNKPDVKKYIELSNTLLKKKCNSAELKGDDTPEACDSVDNVSTSSLGNFSGTL